MHFRSHGNDRDDAIINGCSHAQAGQATLVLDKASCIFVDHTTNLTETLIPLDEFFFSLASMGTFTYLSVSYRKRRNFLW